MKDVDKRCEQADKVRVRCQPVSLSAVRLYDDPHCTDGSYHNRRNDGQRPQRDIAIEAARRVGVMIPHFAITRNSNPTNCRIKMVEIEKMPKLQRLAAHRRTKG